MKTILSDIPKDSLSLSGEYCVFDATKNISPCIGCFGCWFKDPGKCLIHDGYEKIAAAMGRSDEVIIISKCMYGSVSPSVKKMFDRSLAYSHPRFLIRKGEMHHKRRYANRLSLKVIFYGDVNEQERMTARKLIEANALNYDIHSYEVIFLPDESAVGGMAI